MDALADMYPDHPAVRDYRKLKEGAPETVASVLFNFKWKIQVLLFEIYSAHF